MVAENRKTAFYSETLSGTLAKSDNEKENKE